MVLGRIEEAEGVYLNGLQLNPKDDDILFNLGNLYVEIEEYNRGIQYYNEVLKINPNHRGAFKNKQIAKEYLRKK